MKQEMKKLFEMRKEGVMRFWQNHKFGLGYAAAMLTVYVGVEVLARTALKCDHVDVNVGYNSKTDGGDVAVKFTELNKWGRKAYERVSMMSVQDAEELVELMQESIDDRKQILNKD